MMYCFLLAVGHCSKRGTLHLPSPPPARDSGFLSGAVATTLPCQVMPQHSPEIGQHSNSCAYLAAWPECALILRMIELTKGLHRDCVSAKPDRIGQLKIRCMATYVKQA